MKTITRGVVKTLILLLALTLVNCQKEDDNFNLQEEAFGKLYKQRSVALSEIPQINNFITSTTGKNLFDKTEDDNQAIFDVDNILEIIDTLNNVNYSFNFRYQDTPIGEFYNLVVGQTPDRENITPFVLKYKCDIAYLDGYIANGMDFTYFKGNMARHRYTDFFEQGTFNKGDDNCPPDFDEVGDPIACESTPIDTGGIDGGNSGDGSEGSSDGGSGLPPIESTSGVSGWLCNHRSRVHVQPSDCNHPEEGGVWVVDYGGSNNGTFKLSKIDCPECITSPDGGVGVNTISMSTKRAALKSLGLSVAGIGFIGASVNNEFVTLMYNFLEASTSPLTNEYTIEAEIHVAQIIESAADGSLITASPFVKYPPNSNYATLYPKLTEYLKNQLPTITNNTTITNAIKTYTNLTIAQMQQHLKWGQGPNIRIEQLGASYGEFRKGADPNSLYLDIDLVNQLENTTPNSNLANAFAFLVGVTVLHEYVHYGDYNYNGDTWNYPQEEGLLFEADVYGQSVWISNAEIILKNN